MSPGAVILAGYAREQMDTVFAVTRGVKQLKGGETHPLTGERRYSITLRKAA